MLNVIEELASRWAENQGIEISKEDLMIFGKTLLDEKIKLDECDSYYLELYDPAHPNFPDKLNFVPTFQELKQLEKQQEAFIEDTCYATLGFFEKSKLMLWKIKTADKSFYFVTCKRKERSLAYGRYLSMTMLEVGNWINA